MGLVHTLNKGFTLLEMLVVLSLIGLMAGFVAPDLMSMTDRIAFAMEREKFEHALAALPYEAYRQKKDLLLESTKDPYPKPSTPSDENDVGVVLNTVTGKMDGLVQMPILIEPAPLKMPENWVLKTEAPILYRAAGYCNGGRVDVLVGTLVYQYELKAPECQPIIK